MKEPIKIDEKEMTQFTSLKDAIQKLTMDLGILYIEKIELDQVIADLSKKETTYRNLLETLQKDEKSLIDSILAKYGEGNLNLKEGIFQPF